MPWIPTSRPAIDIEEAVAEVFAIHGVEAPPGSGVIVFRGQFLRSPELAYESLSARFRPWGFVPVLRQEAGHDVILAYPLPAVGSGSSTWTHVLLFLATVLSTLWAGVLQNAPADLLPVTADAGEAWGIVLRHAIANWTDGLPFSMAILAILGVHEFGHYFVARHYGLAVSLPYFIPFPLNEFSGTLGAVIRIKSPFESKKALFDVGIAGPLAGLCLAIPITAYGLATAEIVPAMLQPGTVIFSEPLLFQWMSNLIVGPRESGTDLLMNSFLMAGWLGFLVTAINLVPVSQLDGGHIAYAMLGRRYRVFARLVFAAAALVVLLGNPGYLLMVILIFLMGIDHPPALNDLTDIGPGRKLLGLLTFLLALTLITLQPFRFL